MAKALEDLTDKELDKAHISAMKAKDKAREACAAIQAERDRRAEEPAEQGSPEPQSIAPEGIESEEDVKGL